MHYNVDKVTFKGLFKKFAESVAGQGNALLT